MSNVVEKQKVLNDYKNKLAYMVSDGDIRRALPEAKTMKYSELADYKDIFELLPHDKSYVIVLTETGPNRGHWCSLMRYGNTIEWFDSYGVKPDGELSLIPQSVKRALGEDKHYLSRLLKALPKDYHYVYNKAKLQRDGPNINTCGKWSILRVEMMKMNYDLPEFIEFIKRNCKAREMPSDILVAGFFPF